MIFIIIILFSFKYNIKSFIISTSFSLTLVYENLQNGQYICMTKSNNGYLYIVTGEDSSTSNNPNRFIIKYNTNSMVYEETIAYNSDHYFANGESFIIGAQQQYLFTYAFFGSVGNYEAFNLDDGTSRYYSESISDGEMRVFLRSEPNYYSINIKNGNKLYIRKLKISSPSSSLPVFNIENNNDDVQIENSKMISCAFNSQKNKILCAYYFYYVPFNNIHIKITIYNSNNLSERRDKILDEINNFYFYNFIKIVYLKGDSYFVLMDCQHDSITRLRYFDEDINDKLNTITNEINQYLDIPKTQYNRDYDKNDIIAFDSNKVVKIFLHEKTKDFIITIIKFYDDNISMSIKIYNINNNNLFDYYLNPRIEILKNSFVITLSAYAGSKYKPGYFFINFPNSTDFELRGNRIIVNNIISIENKLFLINKKLKILNIPTDFILINSYNSVVNIGDELEEDDELILRQYRVNEGEKILEYQAVARGYDSGYSYLKIYPTDKKAEKEEIFFEGRIGKIKINFPNCLDGYYPLDIDTNLCTNYRPYNFYFDEENHIYMACNSSCDECIIK